MILRDFSPDTDYPAVVRIHNAVFPTYADTVDEWRFHDEHRDPKCLWKRFVAEVDGEIVGFSDYSQSASSYDPRKFEVMVAVLPESRRRGIGDTLYRHTTDALAPFEPTLFRAYAQEDQPESLRFLMSRGFSEDMRYRESWLDVPNFDFAPYETADEKPLAHGIRFVTFTELLAGTSKPETFRRELHALMEALHADVPSPDPHTPTSYETWASRFDSPNFLPDANFIALAPDGSMVGASVLWKRLADSDLQTGLTGVRREHRRQGIALALKLRAIRYAKAVGAPTIRTDNESNNVGMLSINDRLGFVPQPAWLDFSITVGSGESEVEG